MTKVVLIDSKNLAYRYGWTNRNLSWEGFPTGVLYGALSAMLGLAARLPDTPFIWCWDGAGKTWRHKLAPGIYKANRRASGGTSGPGTVIVSDIFRQLPILQHFLRKTGFRSIEVSCLECDDLIGILTTEISKCKFFDQVIIHSGDRDFYQFAAGNRVRILKKISQGKLLWVDQKDIEKEFRVPCEQYTQLRAITGDASDNIPKAFPFVGPKTAAKYVIAGLDASKVRFEDLPAKVRRQFRTIKVRGETVDVAERWPDIHRNYVLSQIIRSTCDEYLPESVREKLKVKHKKEDFLRDRKLCGDEAYRYMTAFFHRFGLADLLGRRDELWKLP